MDIPYPYWAHHAHSDEHLNHIFATPPQQPPPSPSPSSSPTITPSSSSSSSSYSSDHHLNRIHNTPTVRQQRLLFHSPSLDSGYHESPSSSSSSSLDNNLPLRSKRLLRVVNATPSPLDYNTSSCRLAEENRNHGSRADWSVDSSETEEESPFEYPTREIYRAVWPRVQRGSDGGGGGGVLFFSRAVNRVRECVGEAVVAVGLRICPNPSPSPRSRMRLRERRDGMGDALWGFDGLRGYLDDKGEVCDGGVYGGRGRRGGEERGRWGLRGEERGSWGRGGEEEEEGMSARVWEEVKSRLGCRMWAVRLREAKVRFALD